MARALVLLLAAILLAPTALGWTHARGGPGREGLVTLPEAPLDVVSSFHLPLEGGIAQLYAARAFETSDGVLAITANEGGCKGFRVRDVREGANETVVAEDCRQGTDTFPFAYDAQNETIYLCQSAPASEGVLQARDARTLELRWSLAPADFLGPGGSADPSGGFWACMGGALDAQRREIVVPFGRYRGFVPGDYAGHRVVSVHADTGELQWVGRIPQQLPGGGLVPGGERNLHPQAVTLTSNGVILTGREACAYCIVEDNFPMNSFVAWFTREGAFRGYDSAKMPDPVETGATPRERTRPGSEYAVANGPTGIVAMGGRVVLINPEFPDVLAERPIVSVEPPTEYVIWPSPHVARDVVIVPLPHSVSGYASATLEHVWSWGEDLDWSIADTVAGVRGDLLVLISSRGEPTPWIVRLDAATGREMDRLPLPLVREGTGDGSWYADFVALSDGHLLVMDNIGQVAVLGQADPALAPRPRLSAGYPAPGEAIALRLPDASAGATSYRVQWGDGEASEGVPGEELRHAYAQRGAVELRVTGFFPDGRSATTPLTVRVGETPPPELTALQRAFSPEYQEWTFFVLGLLVTVVGVGVTLGRQRRRFNRLERELSAVEEIRLLSVSDPRAAVLALKSYRDRLPEDLARRRIDDSQYHILDLRSARLLKVLRTRMFAPFDDRLSTRYQRLLEAAFEDAILQPSERDALVAALDGEDRLPAEERAQVVRILQDFTSERRDLNNA